MKLALIGKNIQHSLSKIIYSKLLDKEISYSLIDCPTEEELPGLEVLFKEFDGVSVTSPYKSYYFHQTQNKIPKELGFLNTLKKADNTYHAALTDLSAFSEIWSGMKPYKSIAVLGDGSMGSMVSWFFENNNISFSQFSRKLGNLESADLTKFDLIINTCSRDYIFNTEINIQSTFWDFNYHHPHEKFLERRSRYISGLGLLKKQAEHALMFWEKTK